MSNLDKPDRYRKDVVAISAYGNHGFRFDEMSHKGHLMITPEGMYTWNINTKNINKPDYHFRISDFEPWLDDFMKSDVLIVGTGEKQYFLSHDLRNWFADHNIFIESMSTGSAISTYNILLEEKRTFSCALLSVSR